MGAANHAHAGLEADHAVDARRAGDRSVGLRPDRRPGEARRHRRPAARGRAAAVAIDRVGIADEPAHRAPPAGRVAVADIGPFAEIGLAHHHAACAAQIGDHRRVAPGAIVSESERSGGGRQFAGFDIIFHKHCSPGERKLGFDSVAHLHRDIGSQHEDRIEAIRAAIIFHYSRCGPDCVSFGYRARCFDVRRKLNGGDIEDIGNSCASILGLCLCIILRKRRRRIKDC